MVVWNQPSHIILAKLFIDGLHFYKECFGTRTKQTDETLQGIHDFFLSPKNIVTIWTWSKVEHLTEATSPGCTHVEKNARGVEKETFKKWDTVCVFVQIPPNKVLLPKKPLPGGMADMIPVLRVNTALSGKRETKDQIQRLIQLWSQHTGALPSHAYDSHN